LKLYSRWRHIKYICPGRSSCYQLCSIYSLKFE
jgi:hypothetical protein